MLWVMLIRVMLLWIAGLLTIVPYGIWHLFFYAQRDEYAWLITIVLFWIFGFWGVVTPLIMAWKIHKVMRAFESVHMQEELQEFARHNDCESLVIDLISTENHVPKFIARMVYKKLMQHLQEQSAATPADTGH